MGMRRRHRSMTTVSRLSLAQIRGHSKPPVGLRIACCLLAILPLAPAQAQTPAQQKDPDDKLEPVRTSITVVGSVAAETPAAVSTLEGGQLQQTPGDNLDDRLRMVPGFSLFRRSS